MLSPEQLDLIQNAALAALPKDGKNRGMLIIVVETGVDNPDVYVAAANICPEDVPRILMDSFIEISHREVVDLPSNQKVQ